MFDPPTPKTKNQTVKPKDAFENPAFKWWFESVKSLTGLERNCSSLTCETDHHQYITDIKLIQVGAISIFLDSINPRFTARHIHVVQNCHATLATT
jgi:hypothetical protein